MKQQSVTFGQYGTLAKEWCIVEYSRPPLSLWIGAVKLREAFAFAEASKNSEWSKHAQQETMLMVTVHATGTQQECMVEASRMVAARKPVCNVTGHTAATAIKCSNGLTYATQLEAAQALGLNQSAISQHLRGRARAVKGFTFCYV